MVRNHNHTSGNKVAAAGAPRCLTKQSCLAVTAAWRIPVRSMQSCGAVALSESSVALRVYCRSNDLVQLSAGWNVALNCMHPSDAHLYLHLTPLSQGSPLPPKQTPVTCWANTVFLRY